MANIVSINTSLTKGVVKKAVAKGVVNSLGIEGDAHAGAWHRQISFLALESIAQHEHNTGKKYIPGDFGENITTQNLQVAKLNLFDKLLIGSNVVLEVTQFGKKCHGTGCAIFVESGSCIMPTDGFFARVITPGNIYAGDSIVVQQNIIKIKVITLSDRACAGVYPDQSGPAITAKLTAFFAEKKFELAIENVLLPDNAIELTNCINDAINSNVKIIFTTGGTGLGERDITPETVIPLLSKQIPGIMEYIRCKYGQTIPSALLSRSVAGVIGNSTLIYTLPGSVKAVSEYLNEILPTLPHSLFMLAGVDNH